MKKILLSVIMTLISLSFVSAQEKEKLSPVELMFEYYNDEFKPFNKGKWFTALTFNIEDENLQSGNKLIGFDKIIEGQSFNYEVKLKGVPDEIADSVITDLLPHEDEVDIAIKAADKKKRTLRANGRKGRDALYRHLRSRGFTNRAISAAMAGVTFEEEST